MDLVRELKALKPDEPDEEISKDVDMLRQSKPGVTDEQILEEAKGRIQSIGKSPVISTPSVPTAPPIAAGTPPAIPLEDRPDKIGGHDAALAALQGLAGFGDAITRSYGGGQSDYLKTSMATEQKEKENRLNRQKAVSEDLISRRKEHRGERELDLQSQKNDIERMKAVMEGSKKEGKDTFEMEEKLRDGFSKQAKTFQTVRDQYGVLRAAANTAPGDKGAGDIALIFAFMKLVDPGSTVREGEFSTAQNSSGVPDRVRNAYNNALNGQKFSPETRADFVLQADKLFDSYNQTFQANKAQYDALADSYGLKKDRVTGIVVGGEPKLKEGRATTPGSIPTITTPEQFQALAPGAEFIDANNRKRKKK